MDNTTDTPENPNTSSQQQPQGMPGLTISPEQLTGIKNVYLNNLQNIYSQFLQAISQIPMTPAQKQLGQMFMDTGYVWLEKAVLLLTPSDIPVQVITPPQQDTPQGTQPDAPTPANDQTMSNTTNAPQNVAPEAIAQPADSAPEAA